MVFLALPNKALTGRIVESAKQPAYLLGNVRIQGKKKV